MLIVFHPTVETIRARVHAQRAMQSVDVIRQDVPQERASQRAFLYAAIAPTATRWNRCCRRKRKYVNARMAGECSCWHKAWPVDLRQGDLPFAFRQEGHEARQILLSDGKIGAHVEHAERCRSATAQTFDEAARHDCLSEPDLIGN